MSPYDLYPCLVRPLLFAMEPERAHDLTISAAHALSAWPWRSLFAQRVPDSPVEAMGLRFPNAVGLAAGLDKNGDAIDFLGALGLGFIEVGTVTPRPQPGNPRPRMFRIPEARGIINRMGFNNLGVDHLVRNLVSRHYRGVVGVSIGKNTDTPMEEAASDYLECLRKVHEHCDYVAVNVSCPNSEGLTALQASEPLRALVGALLEERGRLESGAGRRVPLVVKVAPDLDDGALEALCQVLMDLGVDGITCANTTTSRGLVTGLPHAGEQGGLSGRPLCGLALRTLRKVREITGGSIPLIGVGGIDGLCAARERLAAGATLLQVYSGLIYEGPALVRDLVRYL
ncbi:MAG: quinone-dependent dihydroorotate dehydrogenase [Succinivibrionaceae bacterium]|nr:quinone-dependent dihydroorotate dehydrogenase [Succinivibrionaceae bacterium]